MFIAHLAQVEAQRKNDACGSVHVPKQHADAVFRSLGEPLVPQQQFPVERVALGPERRRERERDGHEAAREEHDERAPGRRDLRAIVLRSRLESHPAEDDVRQQRQPRQRDESQHVYPNGRVLVRGCSPPRHQTPCPLAPAQCPGYAEKLCQRTKSRR